MIARRPPLGGATPPPSPLRRGVSLIEVLLAFAIFMISIAGVSVLVRSALEHADQAARTNLCSRLASSKMGELTAGVGDTTLSADGSQGTFPEEPNYQWQLLSRPGEVSGTYDVTVRVWSDPPRPGGEVSLSQVVIDPALLNNAGPLQAPTTEVP